MAWGEPAKGTRYSAGRARGQSGGPPIGALMPGLGTYVRRRVRRFSDRSRARRWVDLRQGIDWDDVKRVLDLGGKPSFWTDDAVLTRPLEITCLNLRAEPGTRRLGQATVDVVVGDATKPPVEPADYDLVFSNS